MGKSLESNKLMRNNDDSDGSPDDSINEICKFKTLTSLYLSVASITTDQWRKLAAHLSNLV